MRSSHVTLLFVISCSPQQYEMGYFYVFTICISSLIFIFKRPDQLFYMVDFHAFILDKGKAQ